MDSTPSRVREDTHISLQDGIVDELYITSKDSPYSTVIPQDWDYYTIMHALFNGTLLAGNINFYVENIGSLRLKRRKLGDLRWITLQDFKVLSAKDLNFTYIDKTPRSKALYEYSVVPVISNSEGSLYSSSITTDFHGLCICDNDSIFNAYLDIEVTQSRNKPVTVVSTINRKYPYVISNGEANYNSGTVRALFAKFTPDNCSWDFENANVFRDQLSDFLYNGNAKIIKHEDGRMWLAAVSSSTIDNSENGHEYKVSTAFEWTEIGDCDSEDDLSTGGFIKTEVV
ncbi:MAG: hypothetical protein RR365_00945 [Bacteroides sp.]